MATAAAAVAALAAPAAIATDAHAGVRSPHACGIGGGGRVTASWATSCGFARRIAVSWLVGDCAHQRSCSGVVSSPVTHRTYGVFCRERGHWPERITCTTTGHSAWIRFTYDAA